MPVCVCGLLRAVAQSTLVVAWDVYLTYYTRQKGNTRLADANRLSDPLKQLTEADPHAKDSSDQETRNCKLREIKNIVLKTCETRRAEGSE